MWRNFPSPWDSVFIFRIVREKLVHHQSLVGAHGAELDIVLEKPRALGEH